MINKAVEIMTRPQDGAVEFVSMPSRRLFTKATWGNALLALTGCGGGGTSMVPESPVVPSPPPKPPISPVNPEPEIPVGISLLAGQTDGETTSSVPVDGLGDKARFGEMGGNCTDQDGNFYVIDKGNSSLRKITPSGVVTTVFQNFPMGSKVARLRAEDVLSDSALARDAAGNFYGIRDRTIVKVEPDGRQTIFAGKAGVVGFGDGPGEQATFATPSSLAFDPQGNLLVADAADTTLAFSGINTTTYNFVFGGTVRKITPQGIVSTLIGTPGRQFQGTFFDPGTIFKMANPNLEPSQEIGLVDLTREFLRPSVIRCDSLGNIYVFETYWRTLRRFNPDGTAAQVLLARFPLRLADFVVLQNGDVLALGHPFFGPPQRATVTVYSSGIGTVLAGGEGDGYKLGGLPGSIGSRGIGLAIGPKNSLICCTDRAILRIRLP